MNENEGLWTSEANFFFQFFLYPNQTLKQSRLVKLYRVSNTCTFLKLKNPLLALKNAPGLTLREGSQALYSTLEFVWLGGTANCGKISQPASQKRSSRAWRKSWTRGEEISFTFKSKRSKRSFLSSINFTNFMAAKPQKLKQSFQFLIGRKQGGEIYWFMATLKKSWKCDMLVDFFFTFYTQRNKKSPVTKKSWLQDITVSLQENYCHG